ncbi:MAG: substrate-binding domain-containing protein [Chloroflexi bacterium]|nr:substrate-binding domain-containing protein [Chloroflexota bacterium]
MQKALRIAVLAFSLILAVGFAVAPAATRAQDVDLSQITVGLSMYTLGAPYFAAQDASVAAAVAEYGMNLIATEAGNDLNKQLADVEDLIAQGIDVLILNPKDPLGAVPATKLATEAGIPVFIIDSSIDASADFVTTVQSNNVENGKAVGAWLATQMAGTPVRMALLSGSPGNPVGEARRQGVFWGFVEESLRSANMSSYTIVAQGWGEWSTEGGLNAMEDILTAFSDINVLLCENDSMCLGGMRAIAEAGLTDQILVLAAADAQKEALELIQTGEYGATGLNDPALVASTAVDMVVEYLNGRRDFPKITYTPAVAITQENVAEYYNPDAIF